MPEWYAPLAVSVAIILQLFTVAGHWKLAAQFGWIVPLVLSAIGMTTVMLPRVITMLYTEGHVFDSLATLNNINSTIYVFNSVLFFSSMWTLTLMIFRGRNDILDRIADQERLRKLREDLKQMNVGFIDYWQMAESLPDGLVLIDDGGTILYVNDCLCQLTGFSRTQLVAQPLSTTLIPERYRARHLQSFKEFVETGQRHMTWHGLRVHCLDAEGFEFPVEISFSSFMGDGHRRIVGIMRKR